MTKRVFFKDLMSGQELHEEYSSLVKKDDVYIRYV